MATLENITTSYEGEAAGRYISAALLSANSLENGAVSVNPNIKYKWTVPQVELANLVSNASCDFTPQGTVTLTERQLEPKSLEVNLKLCKANYRDTWDAISMGYSAHDVLPPSFQEYLIALIAAQVAEQTELNLWGGDTANNGEFSGFETLLASNADQPTGFEVNGTTVTASTVIAEIQKVLDATSTELYKKPGFSILIPVGIEKHYIAAQAALGYRDLYHDGKTNLNFQGVPLIVCNGMTDDVMVATYQDNLWFGTGLMEDHNEVRVIDQSPIDGSDNVHFVMKYTAGAQFGVGADIVTYGITNSAN